MTPLDKVEVLYQHLVDSYSEGSEREIRAASKLLMVALAQIKEHAEPQWSDLVREYLSILENDPEKFERMMSANRSVFDDDVLILKVRR
jgi:hypothetical protein